LKLAKEKKEKESQLLLKNLSKREEIMRASEKALHYIEKMKKNKIESTLEHKFKSKLLESKAIKQKDKEMKTLSVIEAEMVKRLKETHLR
jgi:hypothetical protein